MFHDHAAAAFDVSMDEARETGMPLALPHRERRPMHGQASCQCVRSRGRVAEASEERAHHRGGAAVAMADVSSPRIIESRAEWLRARPESMWKPGRECPARGRAMTMRRVSSPQVKEAPPQTWS